MRTSNDAIALLFGVLKSSPVAAALTGGIYTNNSRPRDSVKEDVVINASAINNQQLQHQVVHVNIYVPKKALVIEGQAQEVDDIARLSELTRLTVQAVDEVWGADYSFVVQQHHNLPDPQTGAYFSNIRVEFHSENL